MRKRSLYCVLGVTVAVVSVLLWLVVLPVARQSLWVALARQNPWVFSSREAIDINSGDVVRWT